MRRRLVYCMPHVWNLTIGVNEQDARRDLEELGDLVHQVQPNAALAFEGHTHPPARLAEIVGEYSLANALLLQAREDLLP